MPDIYEQLADLQAKGYTQQQIETFLEQEGYTPEDVRKAIKNAKKRQEIMLEHQIYEYILQLVQQGYSQQQIHEVLDQQGYDPKVLKEVYKDFDKQQDPINTSPQQDSSIPSQPTPIQQPERSSSQQIQRKPHNGLVIAIVFALIIVFGALGIGALLSNASTEDTIVEEESFSVENTFETIPEDIVPVEVASPQEIPPTTNGPVSESLPPTATFIAQEDVQDSLEAQCQGDAACISAYAYYKQDSSVCIFQERDADRDYCYEQFILNGQTELCNVLTTTSLHCLT